jgi:hypothetical protein
MTVRTNERRVREAAPPFFEGRMLYVQAVDDDGQTVTEGAPDFWRTRAKRISVAHARGSHTGPESYLSQANVKVTADAILRELSDEPLR